MDVISNVDGTLLHAHRYYDAPPRQRGVVKEVRWRQSRGRCSVVLTSSYFQYFQKWPPSRVLVLKKNSRIKQMADLIRRSSAIKIPFLESLESFMCDTLHRNNNCAVAFTISICLPTTFNTPQSTVLVVTLISPQFSSQFLS